MQHIASSGVRLTWVGLKHTVCIHGSIKMIAICRMIMVSSPFSAVAVLMAVRVLFQVVSKFAFQECLVTAFENPADRFVGGLGF
jgi:hypothetical protein